MSAINSSAVLVFCPPSPGKPNPTEERPLDGPDTRTRVIQRGSKSNTCWSSVFNMLRPRWKAPNTHNLGERRFEQISSSRRKAVSRHEAALPDVADQLNQEIIRTTFTSFTKQKVRNPSIISILHTLDASCEGVKLCPILPAFLQQDACENLYDYLVYLKFNRSAEINQTFFDTLHVNPSSLFELVRQQDREFYDATFQSEDWDNVPPLCKRTFLDQLVRIFTAQSYGLKISSWSPTQPFANLVQALENYGPLGIGGCFGSPHYRTPAQRLWQIRGQNVYGWTKTAAKIPGRITAHMVLLVGAGQRLNQELVYYIDPIDDSDPAHLEKQRIYVMSYKKLTADSTDFHGFLRSSAPPEVGYAVHGRDSEKSAEKKREAGV